MRVVVCTDRIGALASQDAGAAIGHAFVTARSGTEVAVVPMGSWGDDLARALAALGSDAVVVAQPGASGPVEHHHHAHAHDDHGPDHLDPHASSVALGAAVADALAARPHRLVVDLTGVDAADGGAGLLHALGVRGDRPLDAGPGALAGLTTLDLAPARALVGATELVAVVAPGEVQDLLLGLRGVSSRRGYAAGTDPAAMLATDAALGELASTLGLADAPGLGAAGGVTLALTALGGWTTSGPSLCAQVAGLERTAGLADVVVTGADQIDVVARGGWIVQEAVALAGRALRPCVAVARQVEVSARELRSIGVEEAHALGGDDDLDALELARRAAGVASSWTW